MQHVRYLRYLRENVIHITWCTTLFLSGYLWHLWYLRYFAIVLRYFVKKSVKKIPHKKVWLRYFFGILEKHAVSAVYTYTAVSVSQDWFQSKTPAHAVNQREHSVLTLPQGTLNWRASFYPDVIQNYFFLKRTSHRAWTQFLLDRNKQRFCFSQVFGFVVRIPNMQI